MRNRINVPIPIKGKQKLYRAYVELLQPLLKIRKREADVYAYLLYLNNEKKNLPDNDRFDLIFSTKYRNVITEELGIAKSVLQNCFSELRKNSLIVNNQIPEGHQVFIDENTLDITFKLKIDNNE